MTHPALTSALQVLWAVVRIGLGVWLGFGLLLYLTQSRYVYAPGSAILATPADAGLAFEDLALNTSDGERLGAWYVPGPTNARGTVIVCHGNGGNIGDRLPALQALHRLGFNTLIFDYRGYGASTGKPSEQGTYRDARAAWDWLTQQRQTPTNRVVILGRSLGGAVASHLAAEVQPAGLVVEASFTSLPDLAASLYPIFPARLMCRFRYDNLAHLREVRCPVLVAHSPNDDMIPFAHGRRIFEAANEPKEFATLKGTHNDGELMDDPDFLLTLDTFLARCLTKTQ
jgi:hypothetical protein